MIIRTVTEKDAHELLEIYRPYVEDTAITFEYRSKQRSFEKIFL